MSFKHEQIQSDDDFDNSNGYNDSFGNNNSNNASSPGLHSQGSSSNQNGLSKAELRKTNKPIMEKRRRARINHCLNELKSLILEAMKKDPARHTKLEKADILEMTVKHLQSVQRQQLNMAIQTDPSVVHKFKTGFVECAEEVNRYISQLEGVDPSVRQRLSNHLNNCATSLEQLGSMTNFNNGYRGHLGVSAINGLFGGAATQLINPLAAAAAAAATLNTQFPATLPQDLNNNNSSGSNHGNHPAATATATIQMGGVQLIPSRLPSGEFALIMPNTATNANATNNLLNNNNNNNNSSPFANSAFAGWNGTPNSHVVNPKPIPVAPTPISLSAAAATNFQRFSAFSKPQLQPPQQQQQQPALSVQLPAAHQKSLTAAVHGNISIKSFNTANPAVFHQPSTQHGLLHNSTAATSPPLSPISSICSSHTNDADDSLMHTSSDFIISRPTTPPSHDVLTTHILGHHQHSFTGVFSTPTPPSSADSSLSLSSSGAASSTHLQQQQVSSTSGSDTSANSSASLKRSRSDSSDSSEEPLSKKFHDGVEKEEAAEHNVSKEKCHMNKEGKDCESILEDRDSMWRPW